MSDSRDPMIPAISTTVTGPLGVMHLPRLWLKNVLFALGRLPPDYKHTTGTFDRMVMDTLEIDETAMLAFIKETLPEYLQFEAWVRDQARNVDAATIAALNARFVAATMSDAGAAARRNELGVTDDILQHGIILNDLDDWSAIHRQLTQTNRHPVREVPMAQDWDFAWQALEAHFGQSGIKEIVSARRRIPSHFRPDLQAALFAELDSFKTVLLGIHQESQFDMLVISGLTMRKKERVPSIAPLQYEDVDVGEGQPISCISNGLWLLHFDEAPLAIFLSQYFDMGSRAMVAQVEIAYPPIEAAAAFARALLERLQRATTVSRLYRGKTLSFEEGDMGFGQMLVHRLAKVDKSEVILDAETMRRLNQHIFEFHRHRAALKGLGQSTRKGILLYGPPGTGKTHIIRYITTNLSEHTTVLIMADQVKQLAKYMELARTLQPSIVVIEDVDLIGRSREKRDSPGAESLLNLLLNEMDGLKEDADILFILTTNRPEGIEAALASRPGRIDEAIEVPLPDEECRTQLVALYGQQLTFADGAVAAIVGGAAGSSAAFVKELVRRVAQRSLSRNADGRIVSEDVETVLGDIAANGSDLRRRLLGAASSSNAPD